MNERINFSPEHTGSNRKLSRIYTVVNETSADPSEVFIHTILEKMSMSDIAGIQYYNATKSVKAFEDFQRTMNIAVS